MTTFAPTEFELLEASSHHATRAEAAAMRMLAAALAACDYHHLYLALTNNSLYISDFDAFDRALAYLPAPTAGLVQLVATGATRRSPIDSPDLLSALASLGLLHSYSDQVTTNNWIVVPALGRLALVGTPSSYAAASSVGASGYFGPDSLLLTAALPPVPGLRALDLGAGSGVQGICGMHGASETVLTEIDPFALRLSALNVEFCEADHPVRLLEGDLFTPVGEERFDLIAALPPYVPVVEGCAASIAVAGGRDGLGILRRLLAAAPDHLLEGGRLVLLAQLLCDDEGPLLERELQGLIGNASIHMICTAWTPLQPYLFELTMKMGRNASATNARTLLERYSTSLRSLGATAVCNAVITLSMTPSGAKPEQRRVGPSGQRRPSDVPRRRVGAEILGEGSNLRLVVNGIDRGLLNAPSAALLEAADGTRNVRDCLTAAWGAHPVANAQDFGDQAISRFQELERLGACEFT